MALREIFARFTTQWQGAALKRGNSQVSALTTKMGAGVTAVRAMGAAFAGLAIVGIIRGWISAANEFVVSMAGVGDELDKTSRALGISTTALQEWQHAAGLSGLDASAFNGSLRRLGANMGTALITPTSAAAIEFRRLGVNLRDPNGELRDMTDVMLDMADPISNMGSSAQRVATLTALLGRQGASMGPLFEGGREGIEAMRAELEALGGGASQEMIQASADMVDAQARLDLATLSLKSRLAVILLPVIESTIEAFTDLTAWFARNESAVLALKVAFWTLVTALGLIGAMILITISPLLLLLAVLFVAVAVPVALLVLIIQDLYVWFEGGESVISSFTDALLALAGTSLAGIRAEITETMDALRDAYNTIAEPLGLPTLSGAATPQAGPDTSNAGPKIEGAAEPQEAPSAPGVGAQFLARLRATGQGRTSAEAFAALRGGSSGSSNVTQTTTVNVTGVGGDPATLGAAVRRAMDGANRDAVEALGQ